MKKSNIQPEELTPQIIDALKRRHGQELFLVEVEAVNQGDTPIVFVFKKPDRKVLSAAAKFAINDPIKGAEIAITNCMVFGDASALDDVAVFQAVSEQFEVINRARVATIKNL